MADVNQEAAQTAALLQQVNKELAQFGEITQATAEKVKDAEMKSKYGIDNFSKSTATAAQGLGELAKGATSTFKAMADGKKGAAAFNEGLDHMTQAASLAAIALTMLIPGGPLIKGLVAGLTAITVGVIQARAEFQKMSATMSDKLYKSYSDLAKSGAAASTGMTGVLKLSSQLSLTMDELSDLTGIVAGNSQELALLGGTAAEGVKKLGDMGEAMKGSRREFLALGMSTVDIAEGQARYLKEMSRTGRAQTMTNKELADSARNYILETDRLAQITGMNAKQQQDVLDRAKSSEMFNAKIRELELQGTEESKAAADELKKGLQRFAAIGPGAEAGFKALVTGNLRSADAQKLNFSTAGVAQKEIMGIANGTRTASQAFGASTKAMARHEKTIGIAMSKLDAGSGVQLASAELEKGAILSNLDEDALARRVKEEQDKKLKASGDKLLKGQVDTVDRQIEANQEINKLVAEGIPAAQKGMIDVAEASVKAAKALARLAGVYKTEDDDKNVAARKKAVEDAKIGGMMSDTMLNDMGMDFGNLSGADGGVFKGPESGYPVLMHGTEAIVPMDKLTGANKIGGIDQLGASNNVTDNQGSKKTNSDKMEKFVKSMLKDTESLTNVTNKDLTRTKNFSLLQTKLFEKKTALMEDEIEILDEQNEILEKMLTLAEKVGGKEAAAAMKKSFTMSRMGMSGGGMAGGGMAGSAIALAQSGNMRTGAAQQAIMGGGSGLSSGGRPAAPGMGGGSGLTGGGGPAGSGNPNDLLRFGGHSGSASNFEALDDRLEKAVMLAASEYNSLTGNKLQINSAKRDPDDQVRLYQETIDAGRPGIGPTGMPVGRPGTSSHEKGLAVDIQNYSDPAAIKALNNQGLQQVVPKDPVHFQLSAEKGMVADGPDEGYQATLHGKEAVIPMQNNSGDFIKLFENMASDSKQMLAMMQEMVKAQKDSTSVANKMLRMQS
jgi:hypothetical protein